MSNTNMALNYVAKRIQDGLHNWAPNPSMPPLWTTVLHEVSDRLGIEPHLSLPPRVYDRCKQPLVALLTFLTRELDNILTDHPLVVEKEYDRLVQEHHDLCTFKYDIAPARHLARITSSRQDVTEPISHNENACLHELAEQFEQEFPQLAQAIGIRELIQGVPLHPCDEGPYDAEYYFPPCLLIFEALLRPAIEADTNAYVAWKIFKEAVSC